MVLSMDRWVGKVAIVTGASSGIGAAVAEQLVEKGLKVVALARRKERLDQLAKKLEGQKGKLYPIKTDVSKEEDILNAFKWIKGNLGPVHVLVNNAGILGPTSLSDGDSKIWRDVINVNILGLSIATREAVRDMKANNVDGHIIHINSVVGHQVINVPEFNVYPATKFAVTALAETLRLELNSAKSKIKITSLSPGLVDTEIIRDDYKQLDIFQKAYNDKAVLDPQDIADGVVYALSTPPHVQSISPGLVDTDIIADLKDTCAESFKDQNLILRAEDIADSVVYALSTPRHVQVQELTIRPVIEIY